MSLTFLQAVNRLATEAGVTGNASSVAAVTGQTGMAARLVNWIAQAHTQLQLRHDNWAWLRSTFTVNTTSGDDTYAGTDCTDSRLSAAITRFDHWIPFDDNGSPNIKIYLTSDGVGTQRWMVNLPWSYFVAIYRRGTQNNGVPVHVTIDPQHNLVLGPKPDGIYTITGEYQRSALQFTADADTPEFPGQYHDILWAQALEMYGRYNAAGEVLARGQVEGRAWLRQLERNQLPTITMGEPLA